MNLVRARMHIVAAAQRTQALMRLSCSEPAGNPGASSLGGGVMQTAQPRDIGALVLVIGVFLVLFVLSLMLGSPAR